MVMVVVDVGIMVEVVEEEEAMGVVVVEVMAFVWLVVVEGVGPWKYKVGVIIWCTSDETMKSKKSVLSKSMIMAGNPVTKANGHLCDF